MLGDRLVQVRRVRPVVLGGGSDHAGAERLGQHQHVARLRAAFRQQVIRVDQAGDAQAILRLAVNHRVPPGDHRARLGYLVGPALKDGGQQIARQVVGPSGDIQRQDRAAPHRVDIAQRVRRGDGPELVGVVHNGREEVERLHERLVRAKGIDRRIVADVQADKERRVGMRFQRAQHVRQVPRTHLAGSARAASQAVKRTTARLSCSSIGPHLPSPCDPSHYSIWPPRLLCLGLRGFHHGDTEDTEISVSSVSLW